MIYLTPKERERKRRMARRVYVGGSTGPLAIQLVAPGSISPLLTFSRTHTPGTASATAIGADGFTVASFAQNVARFNGSARRLLIEGARTNSVTRPSDLANAPWGVTAELTATAAAATGPDGVANSASTLLESGTGNVGRTAFFNPGPTLAAGPFTVSAWFAPSGRNFAQVCSVNNAVTRFAAVVNLTTGAVVDTATAGTPTNTSARAVRFSNGWTRLEVTQDSGGVGPCDINIAPCSVAVPTRNVNLDPIHVGVVSQGVLVWGAQIEAGAFASTTALPPTPGTAARGADTATATLSGFGVGGSSVCTVLWSGVIPQSAPAAVSQNLVEIHDGTISNRFFLLNPAGGNVIRLQRATGGAAANADPGTMTPGTLFRVGMTIRGDGTAAASFNGGAVASVSGGPTTGLTTLRLGDNAASTAPLFGEIGTLRVLPRAVTDADLQTLVANL